MVIPQPQCGEVNLLELAVHFELQLRRTTGKRFNSQGSSNNSRTKNFQHFQYFSEKLNELKDIKHSNLCVHGYAVRAWLLFFLKTDKSHGIRPYENQSAPDKFEQNYFSAGLGLLNVKRDHKYLITG